MLLTPALLAEIVEIIKKHHAAFVVNAFGHDSVSPSALEKLKAAGLIDADAQTGVDDAYVYGQLLALLEDPAVANWTAAEVKAYVAKHPIPLTSQEKAAMNTAKLTAGMYVVGLGNVIEKETGQLLINADHELAAKLGQDIKDETAKNIAARGTVKQLKSAIGHATGDWTRNLDRVAITEKQNAMQLGVAGQFRKHFGDDVRVCLMHPADCCEHCRRLTVGPDGHPRIFKLSQLPPPGANVKKSAAQWVACVGTVHPHCQQQMVRLPIGWGFNKDGEMVPGGKYGVEHDEAEKSLVDRVRDEENHLTRLRKAYELAGRMEFHGLVLAIEQRAGDVRMWTDRHGASGTTTMTAPYGFIEGTKGRDGEPIDCYVGPNPDPTHVYVINQKKKLAGGGFGGLDEQKTFIGFSSAQEAKDCYLAHMNDPGFFGSMVEMPFEDFRKKVTASIPETILQGQYAGAARELFVIKGENVPEFGEGDYGGMSGGGANIQVKGPPRPVHATDFTNTRFVLADANAMRSSVTYKRDPHDYEYGDDDGRLSWVYTLRDRALGVDPMAEESKNEAAEHKESVEHLMQQVLDVKRNLSGVPGARPPRMKKELLRPVVSAAPLEPETAKERAKGDDEEMAKSAKHPRKRTGPQVLTTVVFPET